MPEAPITTIGTITKVLSPGTYRATVPNGKNLIVHLPKAKKDLESEIAVDDQVKLEFTPYDFEKARIAHKVS